MLFVKNENKKIVDNKKKKCKRLDDQSFSPIKFR